MISGEECRNVSKRGDYFAIRPMISELDDAESGGRSARDKELSSSDNVLSFAHTQALLEANKLLPHQDSVPFDFRYQAPGMSKMRVMTIIGTRPEVIKLSRVIAESTRTPTMSRSHTGQNFDYELNQIFFDDLGIPAKPTIS